MTGMVSRMSMGGEAFVGDDQSCMTNVTRLKSVSYMKHKKSHQSVPPSPSRKSILGSKKIELPYIIDVWNSVQSRMSCSVQVQMLSGTNLGAYLRDTCVSTD